MSRETSTVFVLTNDSMPGAVMITRDHPDALFDDCEGVMLPFDIADAVDFGSGDAAECALSNLRRIFADHRPNPRRDFFHVDARKAKCALASARSQHLALGDRYRVGFRGIAA